MYRYPNSRSGPLVLKHNHSNFTGFVGDKLVLDFGAKISALIYYFTREITKLLWKPFFDTTNKLKTNDCVRNLPPMMLKVKGEGNNYNFDKTQVTKLFPNFTRHQFITHSYL